VTIEKLEASFRSHHLPDQATMNPAFSISAIFGNRVPGKPSFGLLGRNFGDFGNFL